jgi:hypothetical protein
VITKEIIFEVTCTYTILIIYVSGVRWDQKNLKMGMKDIILIEET